MYVIAEDGARAVNLDQCMVLQIVSTPEGEAALVANPVGSPNNGFILASGGDRPKKAAVEITKGMKAGKHVVDLNDFLGDRPNLTIPSGGIILPGDGERR